MTAPTSPEINATFFIPHNRICLGARQITLLLYYYFLTLAHSRFENHSQTANALFSLDFLQHKFEQKQGARGHDYPSALENVLRFSDPFHHPRVTSGLNDKYQSQFGFDAKAY